MTVTDLVEDVREELNTELSRLGSSKSLYADTNGDLEPDAVLAAMADATHYAAETAEGWTNADDGYAEVYDAAAGTFRDHYDQIAGELDAHEPGDRPAALDVLRGLEGPSARLGGLLGWTLVCNKKASQASGFFTGQADPGTAGIFREFGGEYEDLRSDLLDALETTAGDDELAEARSAAEQVVGAAYDEYVERLEAQGVNPKPVC